KEGGIGEDDGDCSPPLYSAEGVTTRYTGGGEHGGLMTERPRGRLQTIGGLHQGYLQSVAGEDDGVARGGATHEDQVGGVGRQNQTEGGRHGLGSQRCIREGLECRKQSRQGRAVSGLPTA
ncbi:hypothetical protein GOP47_0030488, partial [Adiantum capillus-veneris]